MSHLLQLIKKNTVLKTLFELEGNPKITLLLQPIWAIPRSLYAPLVTVYIAALGVTDEQLGLFVTVGMLMQAAAAFLGGAVADKYGRRRVLFVCDMLCWSGSALLYALGTNFWWFLGATLLVNIWRVCYIAYNCILIEDSKPEQLVSIFTWNDIASLLSVFFAPITAYLVAKYTLVPTARALLLIASGVMMVKFILLFVFSKETSHGLVRMQETRHTPLHKMLTGYGGIFKMILRSPEMKLLISLLLISTIAGIASNTFAVLYITRDLGIAEKFVPVFPIFSAAVRLVMLIGLQTRLAKIPFRPAFITGYLLLFSSASLLMLTPKGSLPLVVCSILIEAVAYAFISPRMSALEALFVDKQQRARMTGMLAILLVTVSSPFGYFVGKLSSVGTRLPFFFNLLLFAAVLLISLFSKNFISHTKLSKEEESVTS